MKRKSYLKRLGLVLMNVVLTGSTLFAVGARCDGSGAVNVLEKAANVAGNSAKIMPMGPIGKIINY